MYKLIINLKTYKESSGNNCIKIAKIVKKLKRKATKKNVEIIICPEPMDFKDACKEKISVYSQHIDNVDYGAHTGHIVPQKIKDFGAKGTLISHSEDLEEIQLIRQKTKKAKEVQLESCVCVRSLKILKEIIKYSPDFIAVEPKELIGGDISISTANPKLISDCVKASGNIPLLVGAGIKNREDVKKAIELGAKGILVASGVVKAQNIKEAIEDLLEGF